MKLDPTVHRRALKRSMPRKRDRRHDNPGRPRLGIADVKHEVRLSAELDKLVRASAERQDMKLSDWWRRAAEAAVEQKSAELKTDTGSRIGYGRRVDLDD